jgi:hypothetical protein
VGEPARDAAPSAIARWRTIDELAERVGAYCWLEHRLFELTGGWATGGADRDGPEAAAAEYRVSCAAASRRHGALAGRWAERLPVRAGVDATALVVPPEGPLAPALEELGAADARPGFGLLVGTVLPWLGGVYAAHLEGASPVSEAPVMEILVEGRRAVAGELRSGQSLWQRFSDGVKPSRHRQQVSERAFAGSDIFPAVRPS